ncbi:MAG: ribonuclease G [Arenicella sp.]
MSEEVLINITPQETRVAVVENGVLQEIYVERTKTRGLVGNIYRGKTKRVLPGMQAAFIDIGMERAGFLHANDITRNDPAFNCDQQTVAPPIDQLMHEGETVWVQVVKDPVGTKGARLTTELSIPSRYFVYMPNNEHIGISQKIESAEDRQRLLDTLKALLLDKPLPGGFIIRTVADTATDQELADDLEYLSKVWADIKHTMRNETSFRMVHEDIPLALRTLRDIVRDSVEKVRVDSQETYQKTREFAEKMIPDVFNKLEYYNGDRPLFSLYSVESELQRALNKRVDLESGGYLIFDQTEAMTTIDVNTGAYVGKRNHDETLFKTNLEAVHAIARQIKLRNLGGIIIIDFIDMQAGKHRKSIIEQLRIAVKHDRIKTQLSDMSALGLVELTRKRTHNSLEKMLCEPCPVCQGHGVLKTAQTICYQIFRDILREARRYQSRAYTVMAAQNVVDMLIEEEASGLADLQEFINCSITLQVDKTYHQEQYDIVLV